MTNKPIIAVIGSLNVDVVTYGGVAVVKMIGAVGDDSYGPLVVNGLKGVGIDASGIQVRNGEKTGVATIIVEEATGENRIMFSAHANATVRPDEFVAGLPQPLPDLIIMQLEIPLDTVTQIITTAQRLNVPVLFNPAPAQKIGKQYYPGVTHLVVNETEAAILSGHDVKELETKEGQARIANVFHDWGSKHVLITLGSKGVYYSVSSGAQGHINAIKVKAVDTTAAGDTFVGVYALEAVKPDFDIERAVRHANLAASKTVTRKGAQESIPWFDEL
ncbi:unnamed protein product [Parascedosporium putredinis]|uniref:Carbohydrate kinase PfkB domain-containing protein n=1 Tax=Parascedosporium putredinis TaxID=1442378 RepID=A0A9P1GVX3_9PEZI|nr:unnamed protein product [Parascedosporium putredinis]CAI7988350.1 unnamed protein product [Parascedosporium putredinis]